MDVDDDEMLRLALEASAKEHQSQHTELVIGSRFEKERRTVDGCAIFYRRSRPHPPIPPPLAPRGVSWASGAADPASPPGRFSFEKDYGIEFSNVAMQRADMREDVEGFNRVTP